MTLKLMPLSPRTRMSAPRKTIIEAAALRSDGPKYRLSFNHSLSVPNLVCYSAQNMKPVGRPWTEYVYPPPFSSEMTGMCRIA